MIRALFILLVAVSCKSLVHPTISTLPETPYLTSEGDLQYLDFDFIIQSKKNGKYYLEKIDLLVYDRNGRLQQRYKMADEGMVSSFMSFPSVKVSGKKSISIYNPFYYFGSSIDLHRLVYTFTFEKGKERLELTKEIFPALYDQKTEVILPLKGRVIVDSGFDFYAHHRRLNTTHWGMRLLKIDRNITRYAVDLTHADEVGNTFSSTGKALDDYFGFGQQVMAPADGTIIEIANGYPDNEIDGKLPYGFFQFIKNPKLASGNYIVIDHKNGEMSLLAHLKDGSIQVEVGQEVREGQFVARLGNSGDSEVPHLHYQLENEHTRNTQTFPVRFSGIKSLNGNPNEQDVYINTGDLVE